jgi:predicted PurR-regulated permease PerM
MDAASTLFRTSFGVAGELYIILFFAIFFTADSSLYKKGFLSLFPGDKKNTSKTILHRIGIALKGWLKSILISMVLITILLAGSLALIGLRVTIILGLFAGMLEVMLVAGEHDPACCLAYRSVQTAVIAALIYISCQTVVGSL